MQRPNPTDYDNWDHSVTHGDAGIGWYWTDHLKTEVEVNAHTQADFYQYGPFATGGQTAYRSSVVHVQSSGIGVTQLYQFFHNTWVHPYVGAGFDVRRETMNEDIDPVVVYDYALQRPRTLEGGGHVGPRVSYELRPVIVAGLKVYFSERAFFRSDLRVDLRQHENEVVVRVGLGVDF